MPRKSISLLFTL